MSIWGWATEIAIWTLITGSLAVFGWFLLEIVRLARGRTRTDDRPPPENQ